MTHTWLGSGVFLSEFLGSSELHRNRQLLRRPESQYNTSNKRAWILVVVAKFWLLVDC